MNPILRCCSSITASPPSRRVLASFLNRAGTLGVPLLTQSDLLLSSNLHGVLRPLFGPPVIGTGGAAGARGVHCSAGPLGFRATGVAGAEHAVEYCHEEEKGVSRKGDEGLEISKLGIEGEIVERLARKGITKLFPIQRAVLEPAMQGRDMIGRARTGTGKTLAFGIPIMDKIIRFNKKHGKGRHPLAIVLAPTRELARQVDKEFSESSDLDTLCVYGGVPIQQQMRTLNYGVDVIVGTPGRMIDLLKRNALNLSEIQFVVLDEADQMLNVGFAEDVEVILEKMSPNHQTMMFSATMPNWILRLTQKYLKKPLTIDLVGDSDQKLADGITLYSIESRGRSKASILGPLVKEHAKGGKCIIFTQTKRDASQLCFAMERSYPCEALHGDISQSQRERTLSGFRDGRFNILIATDVAARGLDIPNVDLVIHYELPNTSELFVHRSGRTGRAGKKGTAILIYSPEQIRSIRTLEHDVGSKFIGLTAIEGDGEDKLNPMGGSYDPYGGSGSRRSSGFGFGRMSRSGGSGYRDGYGQSDSGSFRSRGDSGSRASDGFRGSFGRSGGFNSSSSDYSGGFRDSDSGRFSGSRFGGFGQSDSSSESKSRQFGRGSSNSFGRSSNSGGGGFGRFDGNSGLNSSKGGFGRFGGD